MKKFVLPKVLALLACLGIVAVSGLVVSCPEASCTVHAAEVADLKAQLVAGLKVRRPQDIAFVNRVVLRVSEGKLSVSMVKSTFAWSRGKKPHPFPFFEHAIKKRAASIGVKI